jgi:trans-2-enoyl-CoA reductase
MSLTKEELDLLDEEMAEAERRVDENKNYRPELSNDELGLVDKFIEECNRSVDTLSEESVNTLSEKLGVGEDFAALLLHYRNQPDYNKSVEKNMIAKYKRNF